MKRLWFALLAIIIIGYNSTLCRAGNNPTIRISTNSTDLILQVADNQRIYQSYLGDKLNSINEFKAEENGREAYQGSGYDDYFEPALGIIHNDGNRCSVLKYVSHEQKSIDGGVETIIKLKDEVYSTNVTLHYVAYTKENVIKTWSVISHNEKKPVTLFRFASSQLYFAQPKYYLTEFSGDWAKEARMSSQQLQFGKKILDSKLGTQITKYVSPFFEIGLGQPVNENNGDVLLGTIGWTGNFRFTFEIDNNNILRLLPSINPFVSDYRLKPGEVFTTPEFIFTLSNKGAGQASRNMQAFARNYQVKNGKGDRMTLLNNWENTYFNFNEQVLADCMKDAKNLGVDMFLLDDGWFGNKYPRNDDKTSLGDWQAMKAKLPHGVPGLIKIAKENGIKFGIWIEPEMVSPKSELFEKHPDWAIKLPNRETYYARNQLVLDLTNPKVQDFVFSVVDNLMKENPDLAFFKWDSNSPITNAYSPYLKENQGNLYIDYTRGLYSVLKRIQAKYPDLRMMMCSSGACRCDYEGLKYFTEFWTSDDTEPVERLYIQWGMSQCFPSKVMCAHVTDWNRAASVKFRTDVASMCKLGFDIGLKSMKPEDMAYCQSAIANYNRLKTVILDGDQYRLVSPYETSHMAVIYTNESKDKAVLFAYNIFPQYNESILPVKLQGLDANKNYRIKEINLMPNTKSDLSVDDKVYSGDYLMKVGINILRCERMKSDVFELTAE